MKNLCYLGFLSVLFSTMGVKASHYLGSDMTWAHISDSTYRVTATIYYECSSSGGSVVTIQSASSCYNNRSWTLALQNPGGTPITNSCRWTHCSTGPARKWIYQGIVFLQPCTDWRVSYSGCCRGALSNVIGLPNHYNEFFLDNQTGSFVSGVDFISDPVSVGNTGDTLFFDCGVTHLPGDSVVYQLAPNLTAVSTPVTYGPGYSDQLFANSLAPEGIDPTTGITNAGPFAAGNYAYRVCAQLYRNGVLRGIVNREMVLTGFPGNTFNPWLSSINSQGSYTICVTEGDSVDFNINSYDLSSIDSTFVTIQNPLPGMIWLSGGGINEFGRVIWPTQIGDATNSPYLITLKVEDNYCPMVGTGFSKYNICVLPISTGVGASSDFTFQLSPNPAKDHFTIRSSKGMRSISLFGLSGQLVYTQQVSGTSERIPIQSLQKGIYLVYVQATDGSRSISKLVRN